MVNSIEDALEIARKNGEQETFIIGGADIYKRGFGKADRLYLTEIQTTLQGDTYFPEFTKDEWRETSRTTHGIDDRHAYAFDFVIYEKIVKR